MSKQLIDAAIEAYATDHTSPESPVLARLNHETNRKVMQPVMLSGHLQGAVLQLFSHLVKPSRVLEIGTFTGYSAICLAQGLVEGGKLYTIDIEEELLDFSSGYIREAGLEGKIIQLTGDATEIIPKLDESFDLVFIDADKTNYSRYFDMVFSKVRMGGIILADNVLYEGDVLLTPDEQSKNARAIAEFNEKVNQDARIEHVLLTIRDGLMVMRKVGE